MTKPRVGRVILHIGPHKTGSTAIQSALISNADCLAETGAVYPRTGRHRNGGVTLGHTDLVNACRGWKNTFSAEAFWSEVDGAETCIISCENAVQLNDAGVEGLRALLDGQDVTVVYMLRRLTDIWPSHWMERVKHGSGISFPEYCAKHGIILPEREANTIDQFLHLSRFTRAFGQENLVLVGYDALEAAGQEASRYFLSEIVGADPEKARFAEGRVNTSNPAWLTGVLRLLNLIHIAECGTSPGVRLRNAVMQDYRADSFPLGEEFEAFFHSTATGFTIRSDHWLTATLQQRVVDHYADRFHTDRAASVAAYLAPNTREIHDLSLPFKRGEEMLDRVYAYYEEILSR